MTTHKILQFDIQFSLDNAQSKEIEKQLNDFTKKGWEVINQSVISCDMQMGHSQLVYLLRLNK